MIDNIYFRQVLLQPVGETVEIFKDSHRRESNFIDLLKKNNESKKVEEYIIPQTADVDVMKQSLIASYTKLANMINEKKEEKNDEWFVDWRFWLGNFHWIWILNPINENRIMLKKENNVSLFSFFLFYNSHFNINLIFLLNIYISYRIGDKNYEWNRN